jgi:hypothetical protein
MILIVCTWDEIIVFYGLGWLAGRDIFGIGGRGLSKKFIRRNMERWGLIAIVSCNAVARIPTHSSLLSSVCYGKGINHSFVKYDDFCWYSWSAYALCI